MWTRRQFLANGIGAIGLSTLNTGESIATTEYPASDINVKLLDVGRELRWRFPELRRHFVFEYYPWYANDPFLHWQQWNRLPPLDLAANTMPHLGAYDSRSLAVLEQHARWIVESGVGAINVSWWGQERFEDRSVHLLMDVMRDHDIRVTFHLEPYGPNRAAQFSSDIMYLFREYGEKRGWDCFLLHQWADGSTGPVVKLFNSLVPEHIVDCRGRTVRLGDYVSEDTWRRVTEEVHRVFRDDFDHVTILSECPDADKVRAAGFDGLSIYGPDSPSENWLDWALEASRKDLVFAFNINPGMDEIERRIVDAESCYAPRPFLPLTESLDWSIPEGREYAALLSKQQIDETLLHSVFLEAHPWLNNVDRGFFLVYVCSFNEWHEGHQFEPMRDASAITGAESAFGYHNPEKGSYRLEHLTRRLTTLLSG